MKIDAILKKRTLLASAGFLALVLAVAGLSLAWTWQPCYKLGGGYLGSGSGLLYNGVYVPLDPLGQRAAVRHNFPTWGPEMVALGAVFGADAATDAVGEAAMISRDTFKWTLVNYGVKQGNPPEIRMIFYSTGTGTFAGKDRINLNYTMAVYAATADADGDGFPDPGQPPAMPPFQDLTGSLKRVPLP